MREITGMKYSADNEVQWSCTQNVGTFCQTKWKKSENQNNEKHRKRTFYNLKLR